MVRAARILRESDSMTTDEKIKKDIRQIVEEVTAPKFADLSVRPERD
jgi:hypothetical protein